MRVAIGCDHGGLDIKRQILRQLNHDQHQTLDLGCDSQESVDYPAYAQGVCRAILDGQAERGILICGTGIGMSMVANRFAGIRAALCHELFTARMSREHNDANVLCLGARVVGPGLIYEIVATWLATEFAGGRHLRRIEMF